MNRLATATAVLAVAAGGIVATAAPASADDRTCRGTISKQTISGDLVVPSGASCRVNSLDVKGNIKIGRGATLRSYHSSVDGNIQSQGHAYVRFTYGWVDGDIQLEDGASHHLRNAFVDGNIQLEGNRGYAQNVIRSRTDGDIQLFSNPKGAKYVYDNRCLLYTSPSPRD